MGWVVMSERELNRVEVLAQADDERLTVDNAANMACRMMVDLLALAHDRGCEAELAAQIEEDLRQKRLPDIEALRALFAPSADSLPGVEVRLADLSAYDQLVL